MKKTIHRMEDTAPTWGAAMTHIRGMIRTDSLLRMVLIGAAANLDNMAVGMAYGMRRIKVPPLSNLAMASIAFLFTFIADWGGTYTGSFFRPETAAVAGAVLLILCGIWIMVAQWRESPKGADRPHTMMSLLQEPDQADLDRSGTISLFESLILGVAISVNCLANGFSAGLWRLSPLATSGITAGMSYLSLWGGSHLGARFASRWVGDKATIVAGCLLILLGIQQLF